MEINKTLHRLISRAQFFCSVVLILLVCNSLSAQTNYRYMQGFVEPCFMFDRGHQSLIQHDIMEYSFNGQEDGFNLLGDDGFLNVRISTEPYYKKGKSWSVYQKFERIFEMEDTQELTGSEIIQCEGYNFLFALFKEEHCSEQGKTPVYHYKVMCDTLVNQLYYINFNLVSRESQNAELLLADVKHYLKLMKHIHLVSTNNVGDYDRAFKYPKAAFNRRCEKMAKTDRQILATSLEKYWLGWEEIPLAGLTGEPYYDEIQNLALQGKHKELLDRYYMCKLYEYKSRMFEMEKECALDNFSLTEYINLRTRFDRNDLGREELMQYLVGPDAPGVIRRLKRMELLLIFFASNRGFDYLKDDWYFYGMCDWSNLVEKKLLQKEDSICAIADYPYFEFQRIYYGNQDFLYFPRLNDNYGNIHIARFERKSFQDRSYAQDWIRLPLSLRPDQILSSEVNNDWIFLATKDSTYILKLNCGNDDDSLDLLNYTIEVLPSTTHADSGFRFVCNRASLTPGYLSFGGKLLETNNWTTTDTLIFSQFLGFTKMNDNILFENISEDDPDVVAAARKSDPSCVLYKKKFSLRDLNHDRCNEYYRYSISNGELIDVLCYSFVNNVMRELPREEAIELIKMEADYKALALYTRMGWE
jgi:hypothetical protein